MFYTVDNDGWLFAFDEDKGFFESGYTVTLTAPKFFLDQFMFDVNRYFRVLGA